MHKKNISSNRNSLIDPYKISVVLPVFNGQSFLREAIDSILEQSFQEFEFIIINDGSTDNTINIIKSYNDNRIHLVENKQNLGITKCLNIGIKLARGEYIARMDADEISISSRFEKQIAFLEKNKEIGICGTLTKTIGKTVESTWQYPIDHERIKVSLLFHCCLVHASVMIRNIILKNYNLFYSENYPCAEDYELWVRLSKITRIANIDEVLIRNRIHNNSIRAKHNALQVKTANNIRENQLKELMISLTDEDVCFHNKIVHLNVNADNFFLIKTYNWFLKLYDENKVNKNYKDDVFAEILAKRLKKIMLRTKTCSPSTLRFIFSSPFAPYINISFKQKVFLFWKIVRNRFSTLCSGAIWMGF